ncbi:MFS transporter [Herbaspirillum rhizosphaerae]|uniref:MFS transporter n=1 Tax=Herbaspirillum rhizosphaerae TaxID=346179 RepID=UPI00142F3B64|nr:MFS transporter [Herbaspirillum rhizosphaerae]
MEVSEKSERCLLTVQTLAGLAQWIDIFLIFTVPSFVWRSSPAEIAFLASCFGLPSLFIGPLMGALLDRVNPRKMMVVGALSRTLFTVLIAFAPGLQVFAGLVVLKGLANLLYWPASAIVTNQVISEARRVKYFSSQSALDQLAKIGTPLVAGFLALMMNGQLVFLISALLTLVCVMMIPRVGGRLQPSQPMRMRSVNGLLQDLFLGFGSIKTLPRNLLVSIALSIGLSFGLAIYDPHLATFLDSKGFDAAVFSMIISATGAGAVTGAALIRFVFNEPEPVTLMRIGIAVFTFSLSGASILFNLAPELPGFRVLVFLWFFNGLGYEIFVIGSSVNTQNLCPPALLGRISTSVRSLQMSTIVLAPSIGAWLITNYSRTTPFLMTTIVAWILCWTVMIFPRIQKHELSVGQSLKK